MKHKFFSDFDCLSLLLDVLEGEIFLQNLPSIVTAYVLGMNNVKFVNASSLLFFFVC